MSSMHSLLCLFGLFLLSCPLSVLATEWIYFEVHESLECDSLPIYLHGITTDRCFPTDEPFFSLWDADSLHSAARSFRVTPSLSPPVHNASLDPDWLPHAQDFVLETFSGAECAAESLLSRALLAYAQPSAEPANLTSQSEGNWTWTINGCSRSPWNAQQSMSLRDWVGFSPPTIISFSSSYTDMTFVNSTASQETCADFDSPANFSVWRSQMCISLDGESSVIYSCLSTFFLGAPRDVSFPHLFFPHSPDCTDDATELSSSMQCEILPPTSYDNNTDGGSESLFVVRRESCEAGGRENDWIPWVPPVDENLFNDDGAHAGGHTPPPHNSSTSQPMVRLMTSLTISPLHENASHTLSLSEEKTVVENALVGLVCGTLSLPVDHCVVDSLSVQPQDTQTVLSQLSHRHLRVSLSNTEASLALFASVNVTLHQEDFSVNADNTTTTYNTTTYTLLLQESEMGGSRSWNRFYSAVLLLSYPLLSASSYLSAVETDVYVLPPTLFRNRPPVPPPGNNHTETVVVSSATKDRHRLSLPALTGLIVGLSLLALLQAAVVYVSCCPHSWCAQLFTAKTMRVSVAPSG